MKEVKAYQCGYETCSKLHATEEEAVKCLKAHQKADRKKAKEEAGNKDRKERMLWVANNCDDLSKLPDLIKQHIHRESKGKYEYDVSVGAFYPTVINGKTSLSFKMTAKAKRKYDIYFSNWIGHTSWDLNKIKATPISGIEIWCGGGGNEFRGECRLYVDTFKLIKPTLDRWLECNGKIQDYRQERYRADNRLLDFVNDVAETDRTIQSLDGHIVYLSKMIDSMGRQIITRRRQIEQSKEAQEAAQYPTYPIDKEEYKQLTLKLGMEFRDE